MRGEYFNCDFETAKNAIIGLLQGEITVPPNAKHREAQKRASAKYEAKVYDKVLVRLPRGKKSEIEAHIKPKGESLNGFISTAIDEKLERDKEKEAGE